MRFDRSAFMGFDVETAGVEKEYALQPYRLQQGKAWVTSSAFTLWKAGKLDAKVAQNPNAATHAVMLRYAEVHGLTIVGWNVAFDCAWLISQGLGDQVMKVKWLDAMLLWQHLEREPEYEMAASKRKSWSLKDAVAVYIPQYAGYDEGIDFEDMSPDAVARRLRYNKMDTTFTLLLAEKFYNALAAEGDFRLRNALIEASSIPLVADSMVTGLSVADAWARKFGSRLDAEYDELTARLESQGATEKVLASPKQLSTLLYEDWGLPVVQKTPKGAPATDKVALHTLAAMDDRIDDIARHREIRGNRTKFVDKVLKSTEYNADGKTRPAMRIYGTYTGRATFASKQGKNKDERQTGFAIHQMKNDPDYRRIITPPEGYTMVEWDAANQEYRWMAIESGDDVMLSLCMPGEDPHSFMGAQIAGVDYHDLILLVAEEDPDAKKQRKSGKVGNLSCQYRIGYKKLHVRATVDHGMKITLPEAKTIHTVYHATYKGVRRYWNRQIHKCRRLGYAETIAGRRVQLTGSWASAATGWKLESTAVNFPIQGIGADQKYLAMRILRNYLPRYGGHFYFELHDGLYAIFPNKVAEKAAREVQHALNHMPYKKAWGFTPPIPLPWDLKMSDQSWGDMKEIK